MTDDEELPRSLAGLHELGATLADIRAGRAFPILERGADNRPVLVGVMWAPSEGGA